MNALYGALGAVLILAIVQVLPFGYALVRTGRGPRITGARVVGGILVLGVFVAAGAAAGTLGSPSHDEAFLRGLGWQSFFGTLLRGGNDVLQAELAARQGPRAAA